MPKVKIIEASVFPKAAVAGTTTKVAVNGIIKPAEIGSEKPAELR